MQKKIEFLQIQELIWKIEIEIYYYTSSKIIITYYTFLVLIA